MEGFVSIGATILQLGIVAALGVAVRRRNPVAAINALVVLILSILPGLLEFVAGWMFGVMIVFGPELRFWIAAAGVIHAVGMLGWYEAIWWWDHLAHTVSAALMAAMIYAALIVVDADIGWHLSGTTLAAATLACGLATGVFWELIEMAARELSRRYGIEPLVVIYGRHDTALDLVFDVVGILLVLAFDLRIFVPYAALHPELTSQLLLVGGAIALGGSAILAAYIEAARRGRHGSEEQ